MLWPSPADTDVTPVRPNTCTGAVRLVVVPSPNWPSRLSPQAQSVPSDLSVSAWRNDTVVPRGPATRKRHQPTMFWPRSKTNNPRRTPLTGALVRPANTAGPAPFAANLPSVSEFPHFREPS